MNFVIPYRNRAQHLQQFLKHYRRLFPQAYFLVVEQTINGAFNKAKLMNIGILEHPADSYVFHDVDMLVQGVPNYTADENNVLHLATDASQFRWQMPYLEYFGGCVILTHAQVQHVNGWSNRFWGRNGEDDEMYWQCLRRGLTVHRRPHRYLSLPHTRIGLEFDPVRMEMAKTPRPADDGLHNTQYKIISELPFPQGRKITVEV